MYLCVIGVWNPLNSFRSGRSPRLSSNFMRNVVVMRRALSSVFANVVIVSSTRSNTSGVVSSSRSNSSVIFATIIAFVILSRLSRRFL